MTPEGKVKELIKKFLKARNINYWMVAPSAYGSSTGMSDFCGVLPDGRWLAIEAKKPKGVPTVKQQAFLDTINANGGIAVCVDGQEALDKLAVLLQC